MMLISMATILMADGCAKGIAMPGGVAVPTIEDLQVAAGQRKVSWPPQRMILLAFKSERRLEVWVANGSGRYRHIATYPITAASGTLGPKHREGDRQVPEGIYALPELNPRSHFHRSLRVGYPNAEDRKVLRAPMGTDIFIHGGAASIGCIAIGDQAIDAVFDLAKLVKPRERQVLIFPVDFRKKPHFALPGAEPWLRERYASLKRELQQFHD